MLTKLLSLITTDVYAQGRFNAPVDPLNNQVSDVGDIINFILNLVLAIGWALVFVMIALGIIQYITSKGEVKATDAARQWITAAAVGGVGMFFLTSAKVVLPNLVGVTGGNGPVENTIIGF